MTKTGCQKCHKAAHAADRLYTYSMIAEAPDKDKLSETQDEELEKR